MADVALDANVVVGFLDVLRLKKQKPGSGSGSGSNVPGP